MYGRIQSDVAAIEGDPVSTHSKADLSWFVEVYIETSHIFQCKCATKIFLLSYQC